MRILYLSVRNENDGGGEGRISWELAVESAKYGNEVLLLAPNETAYGFRSETRDGLHIQYYPAHCLAHSLFVMPGTKTLTKELLDILNAFNPDVVHYHFPFPPAYILQSWALEHRKVIVHTIHINPAKMFASASPSEHSLSNYFAKASGLDAYQRIMYKDLTCMVSVNEKHNKVIREFGYHGPLVTITNGRNLEPFDQLTIPALDHKRKIYLFFVGTITQNKNQRFLVQALDYLPSNFELHLIGSSFLPSQKKYGEKLHYNKRVHFHGQIDFSKIPKVIEEFHFCVSASLNEAFSLSIIEAMAAGKPVVALENDTTAKLVNESNGALLPQNASPKEFADTIERLAHKSQKEYERLADRSRNTVRLYNWNSVMSQYQKLYRDLLESNTTVRTAKTGLLTTIGVASAIFLSSVAVGATAFNLVKKKVQHKEQNQSDD